MLSKVTGGSLARFRATNIGMSVPFSCISRTISSMFWVVLCGPCRFRSRVQFSSAHSSKSRRFDASMSPSWKVAEHKAPMAAGGSRTILFCTKHSSSSMTTPLLLLLFTVDLWDGSAMLDFNPVDFDKQTVANATKIRSRWSAQFLVTDYSCKTGYKTIDSIRLKSSSKTHKR